MLEPRGQSHQAARRHADLPPRVLLWAAPSARNSRSSTHGPIRSMYSCSLDTAQHQISGSRSHRPLCEAPPAGFGLPLQRHTPRGSRGDYRTPPDPERAAATTKRWFWEMGTPQGRPGRLSQADEGAEGLRYKGWVSVEHDKADVGRGNYAESTCRTKWYIDNVLSKIYA